MLPGRHFVHIMAERLVQRAILQDHLGQPVIAEDVPVPSIRPGKVLVKTVAVALNPVDHKMGKAFPSPGAVVGMDFSGHVVSIDDSVKLARPDIKLGDAVCGTVHGSNPADKEVGAFAEYVLAQPETLLHVPGDWTLEKAATLGLAVLTNSMSLWGSLGLCPNFDGAPPETKIPVLVYGGSTATGTMAIQLLRLSGFDTITTCSPRNFELVKSFGASMVFDYSLPEVGKLIRENTKGRLRHAIDCIADEQSTTCCYAALGRPGGRYAYLEAAPSAWRTREAVQSEFVLAMDGLGKAVEMGGEYQRSANLERLQLATESFMTFQDLLDKGAIRTHPVEIIGSGFDSIVKGLQMLKSGTVFGKKLVVSIKP